MEEQKLGGAEKFKLFLTTKNTKTNVAMQQAQRMINLYRSLEDFGDDFVEQYNTELLQIPENVELMLSALVSGSEVRQYLDYLRHSNHEETETNEDQKGNARIKGYLPGPEQDMKITFGSNSTGGNISEYVSRADFEKFKADQANLIREISEKMIANQTQALLQAMGHFAQNIDKQTTGTNVDHNRNTNKSSKDIDDGYSEIIEDKQPGSDAIAGYDSKGDK